MSRMEIFRGKGVAEISDSLVEGDSVGKFIIEKVLGKGGFATVYLALDRLLRRKIALKVLPREADQDAIRLFCEREGAILASLEHPNIIRLYEMDFDDNVGAHFFAMEFAKGGSLEQALEENRVDQSRLLEMMAEITEAFLFAHTKKVIHRDVKPLNIFLTESGGVKVGDFGLAKTEADLGVGKTLAGHMTREYASPEQRKELPLDFRTDIFSLGLVFAHMMLGERLPTHMNPRDALITRENTPPGLVDLVCEMLIQDRDARVQTMEEVATRIADLRMPTSPFETNSSSTSPGHIEEPLTPKSPTIIRNRYFLMPEPRLGEMAWVYRARDMKTDELVAVKLFRRGRLSDAVMALSFKRETEALQELKHKNITQLRDFGKDEETGLQYLVLEWVEETVATLFDPERIQGWDDYAKLVGLPLIEALSLAHERGIAHRDLKPSNILLSSKREVKLADFGISKLKRYLQSGETLVGYAAEPYSPPIAYRDLTAFARDVFAFGVLAVEGLIGERVQTYTDVFSALERLDVPPEIDRLIRDCLSDDPEVRPHNAVVLKARLSSIQEDRTYHFRDRFECFVKILPTRVAELSSQLGVEGIDEIKRTVKQDLSDGFAVARFDGDVESSEHFFVYGAEFSYHVCVDEEECDHLVLFWAKKQSPAVLDRRRRKAWNPQHMTLTFAERGTAIEGENACDYLSLGLERFEQQQSEQRIVQREGRCFKVWNGLVSIQRKVERSRFAPIPFESFRQEGGRVFFRLLELPDHEILGQQWKVKTGSEHYHYVSGEVEGLYGNELVLRTTHGDPGYIPIKNAKLEYDSFASLEALRRQQYALDSIQYERAVRVDAAERLRKPEDCPSPSSVIVNSFYNEDLDSSKKLAVQAALGSNDTLLVHGPPGTGKTTFIAELILQLIQRDPTCRILLTAQTHAGLDNALERVLKYKASVRIVRLGKASDDRVSADVRHLMIGEQLIQWQKEVSESSYKFLEGWATTNGVSVKDVQTGLDLERLQVQLHRIGQLEERIMSLTELNDGWDGEEDNDVTFELAQLTEELQNLKKMVAGLKDELKARDLDELTQLNAEELDEWVMLLTDSQRSKQLAHLLKIQGEWSARFGRSIDFHEPLVDRAQILAATCVGLAGLSGFERQSFDVAIVDEASKATAPETLIPLSRSKSWILVGDNKQLPPILDDLFSDQKLFTDHALRPEEIRDTLFDRMAENLPEKCVHWLNVQHRMVPAIGDLISECFYDGKLKNGGRSLPNCLSEVLPTPVLWMTTSGLDANELGVKGSYGNPKEARAIIRFLVKLNKVASKFRPMSVAVLAGYSGQRELFTRMLESKNPSLSSLQVECNTVDAFQGREADIAIFSITRRNAAKRIGFLGQAPRINVALSRGRLALVIFGDHTFCASVPSEHPLQQVLEYIKRNDRSCTLSEAEL